MKISNLTFIVTDSCNFRCTYCVQKKEKKTIDDYTIDTAVDFFYPHFKTDVPVYIGFYGGEPLMAFEKVKRITQRIEEKNNTGNKNINYTLTTNGTLLTDEILDYFNTHGFNIMLSFDGLAQDIGRKKSTLEKMGRIMKRIQEQPRIKFRINSVFYPQTVPLLSKSIRYMIEQDSPEITFNLAATATWNFSHLLILKEELEILSEYLAARYPETGTIPVRNFQVPLSGSCELPKAPACSAGRGNMSVTPEGTVWGCFMFHDYFKSRRNHPQYSDYSFGTLTEFINGNETGHPEITANYNELRQEYFKVKNNFCFTCEEVENCMVCPVNAAYTSGSLGQISCHNCQLEKIERQARREFKKKIV